MWSKSVKRKHKHLIITAKVDNPIFKKKQLETWIRELISSIDMKIMAGPIFSYAEEKINKGWTGIAIIEFSHVSIHIWENEGLLEVDVFSCKDFDINEVIEKIKIFEIKELSVRLVNRDDQFGKFEKFWVCYKTTNNINGNYYYGVHGASDIDCKYLGSGVLIRKAIEKYGKENFSINLLKFFNTAEEAYDFEKGIVNSKLLTDEKCYNLVPGGKRGQLSERKYIKDFVWITDGRNNKLIERQIALDDYIGLGWQYGRFVSETTKSKLSAARKGKRSWKKGMKGIVSVETRTKTSNTLKERYKNQTHHSKGTKAKRDKFGRFKGNEC